MYAFSPHLSTPPQVNPPPSPISTLPLGFVHVSFIVVPVIPSSHCPRLFGFLTKINNTYSHHVFLVYPNPK